MLFNVDSDSARSVIGEEGNPLRSLRHQAMVEAA